MRRTKVERRTIGEHTECGLFSFALSFTPVAERRDDIMASDAMRKTSERASERATENIAKLKRTMNYLKAMN